MPEKNHERFELERDSLRVMKCGACDDEAKGIRRVQEFRPDYFTADWSDGVLVQVRVWGPRVLDDGSLGDRDLDYRWKKTSACPIKYTDLPRPVARRLLAYNRENGFKVLPEQCADQITGVE